MQRVNETDRLRCFLPGQMAGVVSKGIIGRHRLQGPSGKGAAFAIEDFLDAMQRSDILNAGGHTLDACNQCFSGHGGIIHVRIHLAFLLPARGTPGATGAPCQRFQV